MCFFFFSIGESIFTDVIIYNFTTTLPNGISRLLQNFTLLKDKSTLIKTFFALIIYSEKRAVLNSRR